MAGTSNGPLAVRDFRLLGLGQFASTVGDYCYAVALPWLVLAGKAGPVTLGIVLACYGVPRTVLIPAGGLLADKFSPRTVMLAADTARCALVGVLAFLAAGHAATLITLAPVAACLGAGQGLFLPASFSIMPTLLTGEQLASGNAMSSALMQIGSLAGPALGGLLVATAGSAPAFAVDAATFAISALSLALIRSREQAGQAGAQADQELAGERLRQLLRRSPALVIILALSVTANLSGGGTFEVALPALAHARFGASGYGWIVACFGAGALAGTVLAARLTSMARPALVACGGYLVEAAAIAAVPFLGGLAGAAVAMGAAGLCNSFGNIVLITLIQRWAPAKLLGRVMSLIMLAAFGTFPISVAAAGIFVKYLRPPPFFPIAGILLAAAVLAALARPAMRQFGAQAAVEVK
jgi:MFS family permease